MNSTTKSARRPTITLALPRNVPALISYAQGIVNRMTGNPSFPAPTLTLAAVATAVGDLQTAETAALARTKGAVAARNEKRTVLVGALQQLCFCCATRAARGVVHARHARPRLAS
jgi:hypothetical protein